MADPNQEQQASTGDEFQAEAGAQEQQQFDFEEQQSEAADSEKSPINQDAVNKRIHELTFEKHEERRKREALEEENARLKTQIAGKTEQEKEVVIPPVPDPYDPNFNALVEERDKAIAAKAKQDADKKAKADADAQAAQDQKTKADETLQEQVNTMFANGKEAGIKQEDLMKADQTVAMFIQDSSLASFILRQKNSALLVTHLASDLTELEKISRMDAASGAAYIATKILPKAANSAPRVPGAPDPIKVPKGKGGGESQSPFLKGVTFE